MPIPAILFYMALYVKLWSHRFDSKCLLVPDAEATKKGQKNHTFVFFSMCIDHKVNRQCNRHFLFPTIFCLLSGDIISRSFVVSAVCSMCGSLCTCASLHEDILRVGVCVCMRGTGRQLSTLTYFLSQTLPGEFSIFSLFVSWDERRG